jgi:hypothetical protein
MLGTCSSFLALGLHRSCAGKISQKGSVVVSAEDGMERGEEECLRGFFGKFLIFQLPAPCR